VAFALLADVTMLTLGGSLKRREKISARLGDILSQLYLCSCALKRFEDSDRPYTDVPLLDWVLQDALYKIQQAFDGVLQNFPGRIAGFVLRAVIFPLGRRLAPPSDMLGHKVAALAMEPSRSRDRLTQGVYVPNDENKPVGALEAALASTLRCEPLQVKVDTAHKAGQLHAVEETARIAEAREQGVISAQEAEFLERDYALQRKVIMVDDFAPEDLRAAH
jgi:acyl-CoA dehydrogenase